MDKTSSTRLTTKKDLVFHSYRMSPVSFSKLRKLDPIREKAQRSDLRFLLHLF